MGSPTSLICMEPRPGDESFLGTDSSPDLSVDLSALAVVVIDRCPSTELRHRRLARTDDLRIKSAKPCRWRLLKLCASTTRGEAAAGLRLMMNRRAGVMGVAKIDGSEVEERMRPETFVGRCFDARHGDYFWLIQPWQAGASIQPPQARRTAFRGLQHLNAAGNPTAALLGESKPILA
jgi:hypothetical protein